MYCHHLSKILQSKNTTAFTTIVGCTTGITTSVGITYLTFMDKKSQQYTPSNLSNTEFIISYISSI
jgi:hypothetical protein